MRASGPPGKLKGPLQHVLQRIDPDRRLEVYRLWTFWRDEVGAAIADRAEPAGFRAGVLSVRVSNAAWMQELQFMKATIRERLNARLGEELIRDIYLVSGPVEPARDETADVRDAASRDRSAPREPLPRLSDPRLSAVFERIARAHARRRRSK